MPEHPHRPLKVGIVLPDTESEMAGETAHWRDLAAMAQRAEACGLDSVWVTDHLLFRLDNGLTLGLWECWSLLAALAAVTSRIEIGPLVTCTSFRNPVFLSQAATTVEDISGGRLILGLGAGWNDPEYEAAGLPKDHRVSRFAESLQVITALRETGEVTFKGQFVTAQRAEVRLRGPRPAGPPIMIGAYGARMMQLTAQYADIWSAWAVQTLDEVRDYETRLNAACQEVGRDPASLERSVSILVDAPGAPDRVREHKTPWRLTPAQCAEHLRGYAAAGIQHVQLVLSPNTLAGIDYVAETLEYLDAPAQS
jgi:alkanesulfonate monooxygenase SsuD/methylene tetrahydromethanopterin reductase-like flavin-dependent oxidoreductase (luciferase family)